METKKKLYIAAAVLIVLVVALGLLTACTSESLVAYEAPAVSTAPTSYTLTVQATKGEAVTRALLLNNEGTPDERLDAVWMKSETIDVYKDYTKVGELKPQEDSVAQTSLKGEVSNVAVNDVLTLKFLSPEYANQGGTLEYIAANCDYATASVTVVGIDGTDVTTTGAVFENQQSIVKFTLQDNSNAAISATELIVVADGNTYSIQTTPATNEFFVALPSFSNKTIQVTAANETNIYTFIREGITIESGKYYTLTTQMTLGNLVDLSSLTKNYVAQDGDILTGTIDNRYKISIAAGASITLYNVSINANGTLSGDTNWSGITCNGDATITLVGTNVVNACNTFTTCIQAGGAGTTLTITGTGSLTSTGSKGSAGIGGGWNGSCGDITITGGSIKATGGEGTPGIGSGNQGNCGDISISGGNIIATGSRFGSGIGSGGQGSCGDISISGGTITAIGGDLAAGIGSGVQGRCGDISISGTASGTAKGGENSPCDIGIGDGGSCGTISVQDNTISGRKYQPVDLTNLTQNYEAQDGDILMGTLNGNYDISIAAGASITLYNASITAGITCRGNATITIVGTNVVEAGSSRRPGIRVGPANTTLTIKGTGSLTATGSGNSAGIGSASGDSCGNISIIGGNITAIGGWSAAGIGSASGGTCGNISIGGTASGSATGGEGSLWDIGSGLGGTCGFVVVSSTSFTGSHPSDVTLASCTFTLNFYESYNENDWMNQSTRYYANTNTFEVTIGGIVYVSSGTYQHGYQVDIDLPSVTNMTLTITTPDTEYWMPGEMDQSGNHPKATFSTTLPNMTIKKDVKNNFGEVNLVRLK